jgi:hypothetical protein
LLSWIANSTGYQTRVETGLFPAPRRFGDRHPRIGAR